MNSTVPVSINMGTVGFPGPRWHKFWSVLGPPVEYSILCIRLCYIVFHFPTFAKDVFPLPSVMPRTFFPLDIVPFRDLFPLL